MNTSTEMVNTVQASSCSTLDSAATRRVSTRALATASCNKMKTIDFELKKVLLPPPREFRRHILS